MSFLETGRRRLLPHWPPSTYHSLAASCDRKSLLCSLNFFSPKGLEILAFPCNQFGSQEPGTNEEIKEFACTRFKTEYPIFDKVEVNGGNAAPIYKYLKSAKGGIFGDDIKWNFSKFLIDKKGQVVPSGTPKWWRPMCKDPPDERGLGFKSPLH